MTSSPAIFASAFHPHLGGVEELTRQLALAQRIRGLSPVIVTNRFPKSLPAIEEVEGIEVLRHVFRVPEPNWRQMGGWLRYGVSTRLSIARQLRARRADLVHVQCVSSNGRYALLASKDLKVPLVVTMQGELTMDATDVYQRSAQLRRSWRALLGSAAVITACSHFTLREAEAAYGCAFGDRGRVVYNGINASDFYAIDPITRDRPYVLGLGRLVPQKGFDLLIRAFERLSTEFPDHELLIAGDGLSRSLLERLARDSSVGARIHFIGAVTHSVALQLFAGASAFVLSSRHEPQGIVVLEAMASGTPVVAASVGGVSEIVDAGYNGLLFSGGSAEDLTVKLRDVLDSPELAARLRGRGRLTAMKFDWARIAAEYDDCYRTAAA